MLLFLKKKIDPAAGADAAPPADPASASGFIPYHSHYNPHTLLTKNGELMQTVKIAGNLSGLDYESGDGGIILREAIRRAIRETVPSDKLALWIHTVRKRRPIHWRARFREAFAAYAHEQWKRRHRWKHQYYNEIYISFLHEGQSSVLFDKHSLPHGFLAKRNRHYRNRYLDAAYAELDGVVTAAIEHIGRNYAAQRLSLAERDGVFHSEPMEFLGELCNLRPEAFALSDEDVSARLCTTTRTFGFNALETRDEAGKRRFAAILTLKQYREVPPDTVDRLMQAPMEFVVTQSFHFVSREKALKQYGEQKDFFEASGDEYCIRASGVAGMMESDGGRPTDFGEQQTCIMVLADEYRQLDGEIAGVQEAFSEIGLITIREDLKLEECFWSQLPGNFEFMRRRDTIATGRIGGFCRLNRFPGGQASGNRWGDAVAVLPTMVGSPYFFNFHHGAGGHTAILDFNSFNDQSCPVLLNFLLSESRKFDGRLYVFDRGRSARLLFDKLGGAYHDFPTLSGDAVGQRLQLNPFTLEDTPRNRSFLLAWTATLLGSDMIPADEQKETLRAAIGQLYAGPPEQRNLSGLVDGVAAVDVALARRFSRWHADGALAGLFDGAEETLDMHRALHAFDMTPAAARPESIVPLFSYLLHRIITALDGKPAVIVLHEAWDLVENPFFAPRMESLLEMLEQNNAIVVFTAGRPPDCIGMQSFAAVMQRCATHMIIPDDIAHDYASLNLALSENDSKLLLKMDRQKGDFLLRQNGESIALRADLKELDTVHAVFANNSKHLTGMSAAEDGA